MLGTKEEIGKVSKEIESLTKTIEDTKKNHLRILAIKNAITDFKKSMDVLNSSMERKEVSLNVEGDLRNYPV